MINWTPDDRDKLREYLTTSGGKLIELLNSDLPAMDAADFEQTALQAKEFKGASDIIKKITALSEPQRRPAEVGGNVDVTPGL